MHLFVSTKSKQSPLGSSKVESQYLWKFEFFQPILGWYFESNGFVGLVGWSADEQAVNHGLVFLNDFYMILNHSLFE